MKKLTLFFLIAIIGLSSCEEPDTRILIRVKNPTDSDYQDLSVNSCGNGEVIFGLVKASETTEYKLFQEACVEAIFKLHTNTASFQFGSSAATTKLKPGKYTYVVEAGSFPSGPTFRYNLVKD